MTKGLKKRLSAMTWLRRKMRAGFGTAFQTLLLTPGFIVYFAFAPLAMTAAEHNEDEGVGTAEHHEDGTPCPDGDETPCSRDCSCLCCPGHKVASISLMDVLNFVQTRPTIERFAMTTLTLPNGISKRVFRPPRG